LLRILIALVRVRKQIERWTPSSRPWRPSWSPAVLATGSSLMEVHGIGPGARRRIGVRLGPQGLRAGPRCTPRLHSPGRNRRDGL